MDEYNKGITQFYLLRTHKPYLPLLPSRKTSPYEKWCIVYTCDAGVDDYSDSDVTVC